MREQIIKKADEILKEGLVPAKRMREKMNKVADEVLKLLGDDNLDTHIDYTPEELLEFNGWDWSRLLIYQPEYADKCDWFKLDGWDWSHLLRVQPQFADKCDWSKLNDLDWSMLLRDQPQFAKSQK